MVNYLAFHTWKGTECYQFTPLRLLLTSVKAYPIVQRCEKQNLIIKDNYGVRYVIYETSIRALIKSCGLILWFCPVSGRRRRCIRRIRRDFKWLSHGHA